MANPFSQQWLQGARSCPLCKTTVRGRRRGQKSPSEDIPQAGPSGTRRDDSDDEDPNGGPSRNLGRSESPALTLEELGSYAAGW